MSTFQSIEEAREYFRQDLFATEAGMRLDSFTEDGAVCSVEITARHQNANGGIMGGAIFTLGDLAFAAAANNRHHPTVAQQVSINYFSQPKGKKLIATAHVVKDGRTSCVINVDITDDTGCAVAQFVGTGYKL
ncbi:MAG: PaaI family thioesterase [Lachnospiraceae bacterium]|nr:PaaI family thioesterase [Lachnospiraceae bacterium]